MIFNYITLTENFTKFDFFLKLWYATDKGELVLAQLLCMESPESSLQKPRLSKCHEMGGLQEWKHNDDVNIAQRWVIDYGVH